MLQLPIGKTLFILLAFWIATAVGSYSQVFISRPSFQGLNGAEPHGPLVQGPNGGLYGTTLYGGSSFNGANHDLGFGTIFELTAGGRGRHDLQLLLSIEWQNLCRWSVSCIRTRS